MSSEQLAERVKALADPVRLRICGMLPDSCEVCEEVYNVSELAAEIGLSQPTISHHLTILKRAGLVRCKKMCRDVYYWLDHDAARALAGELLDLLHASEPQGAPAS